MSRRLRKEQKQTEYVEHGTDPEDFYTIQLKKIDAPLVWKRTDRGIRIQDLKEHQFDEVLKIFKNYYMPEDVLCRNTELLEEEESLNCYLNRLRFQLNDCCTIIAIDENYTPEGKQETEKEEAFKEEIFENYEFEEESYEMEEMTSEESLTEESEEEEYEQEEPKKNEPEKEEPEKIKPKKTKFEKDESGKSESDEEESEEDKPSEIEEEAPVQEGEKIVGVLILRIIREEDNTRTFSYVQLIEGTAMEKCMEVKNHVNRKVDIFKKMKCNVFLRYYEMCVIPEYKDKRIDYLLMFSGLLVAHSFDIPVVAGLFPNYSTQRIAKAIGMQILSEVDYTSWKNENDKLIFEDPGPGNYSCALMAGQVPPPPPPPPPPVTDDELLEKSTLPREQKQRLLAKKLKQQQEKIEKEKEMEREREREREKEREKAAAKEQNK